MVRAWYVDPSTEGNRSPPKTGSLQFVNIEDVKTKTGIRCFKIDADNYENCPTMREIKKSLGYSHEGELRLSEDMPQYEDKSKMFFTEHFHADEEIRLVLNGSGYFDVRDNRDKWIRVEVTKGDLIVLPGGIYHRFTLDANKTVHLKSYFVGEPVRKQFDRPSDDHPSRKAYVASLMATTTA